jgi:hypothetical protein
VVATIGICLLASLVFWVAYLLPPNITSFSLTQLVQQNPCLQDNAAVAVGLDQVP